MAEVPLREMMTNGYRDRPTLLRMGRVPRVLMYGNKNKKVKTNV